MLHSKVFFKRLTGLDDTLQVYLLTLMGLTLPKLRLRMSARMQTLAFIG